jgi:hypothetical protein
LAAAVLLGVGLPASARADIALLSVQPATAQIGQRVEVRAGAYEPFAAMPLYLVAKARAPKPFARGPRTKAGKPTGFCEPVLRAPPRGAPFHRVGLLDFRRHPRAVRLSFRVPHLTPGVYEFVIYCDPCHRGEGGSLITSGSPTLRVRR